MKKLGTALIIMVICLIIMSNGYGATRVVEYIFEKSLSIIYIKDMFAKNSNIDDGVLTLVNKNSVLDKNYTPNNLKVPNVKFASNVLAEEMQMTEESANALEGLFEKAKNEGINLYSLSGYRSYETQNNLYYTYLASRGTEYVDRYVAKPGRSEHQLGLAMDVTTEKRSISFEYTEESKWLKDNAHKFGFILRYPKGKENITGYSYEPWHIRYVGVNNSQEIYSRGITLEEFLQF